MSLVESVANVLVGYGVAVVTQILIFPIFVLPFFIYTQPETALTMLKYRYRNLPGARQKAEHMGFRGARYPQPLGPVAAAEQAGMPLLTADELRNVIRTADAPGRLTLVEGAGGLLVELGAGGVTLRDLAAELSAPVLVVVAPGLGTLNHTALTLEALAAKGLSCAGLIIGSWPSTPGLAEASNRGALARLAPVRAALPAGAGSLDAEAFAAVARDAFDPVWVRGLVG